MKTVGVKDNCARNNTDNSITGSTETFEGFVVVENGIHNGQKLSAKSDLQTDEIFSGFNESTLIAGIVGLFNLSAALFLFVCFLLYLLLLVTFVTVAGSVIKNVMSGTVGGQQAINRSPVNIDSPVAPLAENIPNN